MKKRLIATALLCILLLSACRGGSEAALRGDELLSVDGSVLSWAEAQIYILSQHALYSKSYGENIWQVKLREGDFESHIKSALLDYFKLLFLAEYGAKKEKVSLSEAEEKEISLAAAAYAGSLNEKTKAQTGISEPVAREAFKRFAMAQIFHRQLMQNAGREVSDDEARVISVELVKSDQAEGYGRMQEILNSLKEGKSTEEALRGLENIEHHKQTLMRGSFSKSFDTIAFSLKAGQWSPIITEEGAYYLVKCLSPYLEEETVKNKAEMEMALKEKELNQVLEGYAGEVQLLYNPALWESWQMSQYADFSQVSFFDYTENLRK